MNQERFMKCFPTTLQNSSNNKLEPMWRTANCLLHAVIDKTSTEAKEVASLLHHLSNQNKLLQDENKGLRNALTTKKKHNKKNKVLDLQQCKEYHGGAVFWSPSKMSEAQAREITNKRLAEEEQLVTTKFLTSRNLRLSSAFLQELSSAFLQGLSSAFLQRLGPPPEQH
jgi:hypothetical protein